MFFDYVKLYSRSYLSLAVFGRQTILDQEKAKCLSIEASLQIFHHKRLAEFN